MLLLDIFPGFDSYDTMYLLGVVSFVVVISLIPAIFYLLTLQNTLKSIYWENRVIEPGKVWLLLIPVFNLVWMFIVVARIADSIKNELNARGEVTADRPTYGIGLSWCILFLVGRVPYLGGAVSLGFLVCWIIHWVKVNEYKKKFLAEPYQSNKESQVFGHI